jgi:hypothetical protein
MDSIIFHNMLICFFMFNSIALPLINLVAMTTGFDE